MLEGLGSEGLGLLYLTAAVIAFVHTLSGPDHYVPFVAMSRVGNWSVRKTVLITALCGVGHVVGSIVLGFLGILFGATVLRLETIEAVRGDLAGWLLTTFGLLYFAWGMRRVYRIRTGSWGDECHGGHQHDVEDVQRKGRMTPWVLFTIFLFGPCEPLIPVLMYPAMQGNLLHVALVSGLFGLITVVTMTCIVAAACVGMRHVRWRGFEIYGHATAGFAVLLCGIAIQFGL